MNAAAQSSFDAEAERLREQLASKLAQEGELPPEWAPAVRTVRRHRFVPGFYLRADQPAEGGLPVWEPVTAATDPARWLAATYSDQTLITQFDNDEPDWDVPTPRIGGIATSSATLPSLVVRMWRDAEIEPGMTVLEVGTGTGYSTALACERLGSDAITSVEIDQRRLRHAADVLYGSGYGPALANADGVYGYWPTAPFDRIVAACSVRSIPSAWLAQARPGGQILATLGGWLNGHARALLTVRGDGTADGPLLPGTVSFMPARAYEPPRPGNPADWRDLVAGTQQRPTWTEPAFLTEGTAEAFTATFLAQLAAPGAQLLTIGDATGLIDVTSGSIALLACRDGQWQVHQAGPTCLWDAIEAVWQTWDAIGRPGPQAFHMHVQPGLQQITHLTEPRLTFALPSA